MKTSESSPGKFCHIREVRDFTPSHIHPQTFIIVRQWFSFVAMLPELPFGNSQETDRQAALVTLGIITVADLIWLSVPDARRLAGLISTGRRASDGSPWEREFARRGKQWQ
ncbi:hypothetical protein RRG08_063726 [Elysia crispata]|uniref:Uncharacterized protein n=1 Tax=Elysia crispata TaxID=231223 RepID=A0AAE0ZUZ4_9GAST|nr:hypothetical protein RRG08_063726 [Elysia crispata]